MMGNRLELAMAIGMLHIPTVAFTCAVCFCEERGHTGFAGAFFVLLAIYLSCTHIKLK